MFLLQEGLYHIFYWTWLGEYESWYKEHPTTYRKNQHVKNGSSWFQQFLSLVSCVRLHALYKSFMINWLIIRYEFQVVQPLADLGRNNWPFPLPPFSSWVFGRCQAPNCLLWPGNQADKMWRTNIFVTFLPKWAPRVTTCSKLRRSKYFEMVPKWAQTPVYITPLYRGYHSYDPKLSIHCRPFIGAP